MNFFGVQEGVVYLLGYDYFSVLDFVKNKKDLNLLDFGNAICEESRVKILELLLEILVEDQVVCRRHDHRRIRIDRFQPPGGIGDARGRVASHRFAEHLALSDFRNVPQYLLFITVVGHDQEIFSRSQFFETLVRHAYKRLAGAEDIEELLGLGLAAFGPEAAADAAGHDDAIGMFVHDELSLRFVFE